MNDQDDPLTTADRKSREISRRRFLTWTAAGVGVAAGLAALTRLDSTEPERSAGSSENENPGEMRKLAFVFPPALLRIATDLTLVTPRGERPLVAHTKETWKVYSGTNEAADPIDHASEIFYVADPQDLSKVGEMPMYSLVTPTLIYGRDKWGQEQVFGFSYIPPRNGLERVMKATRSSGASLADLHRNDLRLEALGLAPKHVDSVDAAVGLGDISPVTLGSAMGMLFSYPATLNIDATGGTATAGIVYSTSALLDVANAMEAFNAKKLPWCKLTDMLKRAVVAESPVPETLDPSIVNPDWKCDPARAEEPVIDPSIGSQPMRYMEPFVIKGTKIGPPGKEEEVPAALIANFKDVLTSANVHVTNAVQNSEDLGAVIEPGEQPTEEQLTGKTWITTAVLPPESNPTQAATTLELPAHAHLQADPAYKDVKFSISCPMADKDHLGGMKASIQKVERQGSATAVTVRVYNNCERSVIFGLQWFDGQGLPMQPPLEEQLADGNTNDWTWNNLSNWMLGAVPLTFGIPIAGFADQNYKDVTIYFPVNGDRSQTKSASMGRIIAGSSGIGNRWRQIIYAVKLDDKGNEVLDDKGNPVLVKAYPQGSKDADGNAWSSPQWYKDAILATWVVNIGLPALMLALQGVFSYLSYNSFKESQKSGKILKSKKELEALGQNDAIVADFLEEADIGDELNVGYELVGDANRLQINKTMTLFTAVPIVGQVIRGIIGKLSEQEYKTVPGSNWITKIIGMSKFILQLLAFGFMRHYMKKYLESIPIAETAKAIPILGPIYMMSAVAADGSQVTQATVESLTQNNTVWWDIQGQYDILVTVKPDKLKTFAPAAATWYLEVVYQGGKTMSEILGDSGFIPTQWPQNGTFVHPDNFKISRTPDPDDPDSSFVTVTRDTKIFPADSGARSDPFDIIVPNVKFGTPVMFILHILSEDVWDVGVAQTDWISNTDLDAVKTKVDLLVQEFGVPQSGKSRYERDGTTSVQGGAYKFVGGAVPGTVHSKDVVPGSIAIGRGTGLASYVYQENNEWFVRQLMTDQNPGSGASVLAQSWRGSRPWISVDQLSGVGKGVNWLLEPVDDDETGMGGYHVRLLNIDPKKFGFDKKVSYGRFLDEVTHLSMSPAGHLVGVHTNGKLSVLFPSQSGYHPSSLHVPLASYYAGPGNESGNRPGLLHQPVGVVVATNGVVSVVEQGAQRMQAFNLAGSPMKAFQELGKKGLEGDPSFYSNFDSEDPITFLDVSSDGTGYVFVLGYLGDGYSEDQYILDAYAPGATNRLYRLKGFNVGKIDSDPFRNLFSSNFQAIKALGDSGASQPSSTIWIPRTPHKG